MDGGVVLPSSPPHIPSSPPFLVPQYESLSPKSSSPPPLFSSDDSRESVDITNYESPRIYKNKRKGAWWNRAGDDESAHSTPEFKKSKMSRNYDSGVYMMSDATDSSESLLLVQHKPPFGLDETCDSSTAWHEEASICTQPEPSQQEKAFTALISEGLESNNEVYNFAGIGLEDNDIRRIGELASVIRAAPDPGDELPAEGQYRSMMPELYISLRSNHLCRLTPSLFHLQNLTSLILEDNDIQELPAQIGQLHNLKELNIARNKMRCLPFEILPMLPNIVKYDSGNPWLNPTPIQYRSLPKSCLLFDSLNNFHIAYDFSKLTDTDMENQQRLRKFLYTLVSTGRHGHLDIWPLRVRELRFLHFNSRFASKDAGAGLVRKGFFAHHPPILCTNTTDPKTLVYLARTPVSYFDQTGTLCKNCPMPADSNEQELINNQQGLMVMTETDRGVHGVPSKWFTPTHFQTTQSLATISLHAALRQKNQESLSIDDVRSRIGEPTPPQADRILDQAKANARGGYSEFKQCCVCKKDYIVRRAEWIEWWHGLWNEALVPLKVQVCSWGCVPVEMRHRPEREFDWDAELEW